MTRDESTFAANNGSIADARFPAVGRLSPFRSPMTTAIEFRFDTVVTSVVSETELAILPSRSAEHSVRRLIAARQIMEFRGQQQMSPYLAEFIGTMILVLLGDGVCANVNLKKTFGHDTGWMVITTGWAMAVTLAVYLTSAHSGAHLNPAVTVGLAAIGEFEVGQVGGYLLAQLGGAMLGATLVWLTYLPHWKETKDPEAIRGCFCNTPAIANTPANLMTEIIGTFVLVLGVVAILRPENMVPGTGFKEGFQPCVVGIMVWAVGLSLGGATGYAINPARDLGPRIAHAVLPIANKGSSGWGYSWIPVVGPLIGGLIATFVYKALWPAVA